MGYGKLTDEDLRLVQDLYPKAECKFSPHNENMIQIQHPEAQLIIAHKDDCSAACIIGLIMGNDGGGQTWARASANFKDELEYNKSTAERKLSEANGLLKFIQ